MGVLPIIKPTSALRAFMAEPSHHGGGGGGGSLLEDKQLAACTPP